MSITTELSATPGSPASGSRNKEKHEWQEEPKLESVGPEAQPSHSAQPEAVSVLHFQV